MRMRWFLAWSVATAFAAPAAAHEFWLEPAAFSTPAEAGPIELRFLVGDGADIEPWRLVWEKVVGLRSLGPSGQIDQQAGIVTKAAGRDGGATLRLAGAGTHVIAFESHHADNVLAAEPFNAYLETDGLTLAIDQRRRAGRTRQPGREIYSRRAKALVQLGTAPTEHPLRAIGHTLEIVPERNPYALPGGGPLPLRIEYRGAPLAGAKVLLGDLDRPTAPLVARSGAGGRLVFPLTARGRWRASVVWTQPLTGHPRADFETVFASLTFGSWPANGKPPCTIK